MRYFNEDKTIELQEKDIDWSKGKVVEDILIIHHEEQPEIIAIPEEGHYETIAEYPNGGKDVKWVVDKPGVEGREKIPAYDEEERVHVYIPYSEMYIKERDLNQQLSNLKYELSETDYKTLKYMEGWLTAEEYAPVKEYRESLRVQIRELEAEIEELNETD